MHVTYDMVPGTCSMTYRCILNREFRACVFLDFQFASKNIFDVVFFTVNGKRICRQITLKKQ